MATARSVRRKFVRSARAPGRLRRPAARCASIWRARAVAAPAASGTPCPTCGGEGRVRRTETIDVRIPAGVQTGSRVRVRWDTATPGTNGSPPGDLLHIVTQVEPHPLFLNARGDDLFTVVSITVTEAALGAPRSKSPRSTVALVAARPAGHQQRAESVRLREKGMPSVARQLPASWRRSLRNVAGGCAQAGG